MSLQMQRAMDKAFVRGFGKFSSNDQKLGLHL